jgi:hypothetical protein
MMKSSIAVTICGLKKMTNSMAIQLPLLGLSHSASPGFLVKDASRGRESAKLQAPG